jgi:hypothetical protein
MMLGLSLSTFTLVHIAISLIALAAGFGILYGFLVSQASASWTKTFLVFTVLTNVTGFMFPFDRVLPSHVVAAISLVVLVIAIAALYVFRLAGSWRWIYVVASVAALYSNAFVLVVQTFVKNPALKEFAPPQGGPPFAITQALLLVAFVVLGFLAVRRFHPEVRVQASLRPA